MLADSSFDSAAFELHKLDMVAADIPHAAAPRLTVRPRIDHRHIADRVNPMTANLEIKFRLNSKLALWWGGGSWCTMSNRCLGPLMNASVRSLLSWRNYLPPGLYTEVPCWLWYYP